MNKDKRREKGVESRKSIIEAAIRCIAQRGLCDTTLDRVAQFAGVSRTLVVFHFKSKKGMLTTVLEEISSRYKHDWQKILQADDVDAEIQLMRLVEYDIRLPIEKPDLIAVWHTFWGEAKGLYNEFNSSRDKQYSNDLLILIKQISEQGNYKHIDPKIINSTLEAMLLGLWWNAHLNPSDYRYENSIRIVSTYLKLNFPDSFKDY